MHKNANYCSEMVNADLDGLSILYADLVGTFILFTKISKCYHENPRFLSHPIKFAVVESSTTLTEQLNWNRKDLRRCPVQAYI